MRDHLKWVVFPVIFLMAVSALADMSAETLEKEHLARYCINYSSYLVDVGKYLEALENLETAAEVTTIAKTKNEALLSKATMLTAFLDAPEQALKIYQQVADTDSPVAETAAYREGLLLFDLQRFKEAGNSLTKYRKRFPEGRFRFQVEALEGEVNRQLSKPPEEPIPPRPEKSITPVLRVRVKLAYKAGNASITGTAPVCATNMGCKNSFALKVQNGKLLVDGVVAKQLPVIFKSDKPLTISARKKKKQLRGNLSASIKNGKLLVINNVNMEEYLLGVVPSENPASWPIETLKAQAIAARTYAYYQLLHRKNWSYDLVDYAGDQAYGGVAKEHTRSNKAVRETAGVVLMYGDKPILAQYSANSGGYTADANAVFKVPKPYLSARRDPASLKGGMANWTRSFTVAEVEAAFAKINIKAKGLAAIEPAQSGPSGRYIKIRLVFRDGTSKVLRNRPTLRRALDLPEILMDIEKKDDTFIFHGHGWGHGVGYSQWGSRFMGKTKNHLEILAFYYGDVKPEKLW